VYKTRSVFETCWYRVFEASSADIHAFIFWIVMTVSIFPVVVWPKHSGESWLGCSGIWCSASNMVTPPEKCEPINTIIKHPLQLIFSQFKRYYSSQNTCVYDTPSSRNTLISCVWDILSRYTCVHFLNSYDSLNISGSCLTRNILGKVGWAAVRFGAALATWSHHQKNASQLIWSLNTLCSWFLTIQAVLFITKHVFIWHSQFSKHADILCLRHPQPIYVCSFSE